jgi:hypothetical protein
MCSMTDASKMAAMIFSTGSTVQAVLAVDLENAPEHGRAQLIN